MNDLKYKFGHFQPKVIVEGKNVRIPVLSKYSRSIKSSALTIFFFKSPIFKITTAIKA